MERKDSYSCLEILEILPHRFPFLLIDKVLKITRGKDPHLSVGDRILAQKNISFNEPFFQGHFPENPIMPGVLVIESMAQACALLTYEPGKSDKKRAFFILGVNDSRFRKPVIPGDVLELHGECIKRRGDFFTYKCKAIAGGELKAEAEIFACMT